MYLCGSNGYIFQMTAEYQVPSPLVPTREYYFVRYCKQHADGTWAVVDVSLDNLRPGVMSRSRRRPSGCLIQELPNGYSKVMETFYSSSQFCTNQNLNLCLKGI